MTGVWTHYDSVVHHFNHYTTRTPPIFSWFHLKSNLYEHSFIFKVLATTSIIYKWLYHVYEIFHQRVFRLNHKFFKIKTSVKPYNLHWCKTTRHHQVHVVQLYNSTVMMLCRNLPPLLKVNCSARWMKAFSSSLSIDIGPYAELVLLLTPLLYLVITSLINLFYCYIIFSVCPYKPQINIITHGY